MKFLTEKHLSDLEEDKFGYSSLSKKLLDEILLKMELPNCFGLYGNWGSGKSTVLSFMRRYIVSSVDDKYKNIATIHFEAWKYEYSEKGHLLFALINSIKKESGSNDSWKRLLLGATVITSGLFRKLAFTDIQDTAEDFKLIEEQFLKEHERWVDEVEDLHGNFEVAVKEFLEKKKASKLIIFIDDLDRCLPENAVKLLEAIKNFLLVDNTLFVLAIDKRIISEMIEKKYGLHEGYGDEYIMKIINYFYELPTVSLETVVNEIFSTHDIKSSERQRAYIAGFLRSEVKEPRAAKYLLHQFCTALQLSKTSQQAVKDDVEGVKLQYFFIASFLLTKFSKLFYTGDPIKLLRNIRESARTLISGRGSREDYAKLTEGYTKISLEARNKLESIIQHPISGENFIDPDRLGNAIYEIRSFEG